MAAPLEKLGVAVIWLPDAPGADPRLAGHADLSMVHLGGRKVISSCGIQTEEKLAALGFAVTHVPGPVINIRMTVRLTHASWAESSSTGLM